ncbi:MAG: zinc dependent phospholipase C family protein [Thermodesulfovibrionales bacterium]|nr:zinc dependent phospholipase C family protein [Thermodesulfovibrionales bacterium]
MLIFNVFLIFFLFTPSISFAWGPLTHIYLANEIFSYAALISPAVIHLLRQHREDFLYGNLIADMILGKRYLPDEKNSHSWEMGLRLFDLADEPSEKAFVYGYLTHLAADTVAHENLTTDKWQMSHAWLELKADSLIDKIYWLHSITISSSVQKRNDRFLEESLESFIFSFKTNKRIYKSFVFLSLLNKKRRYGIDRDKINCLHDESIVRMIDILQNGKDAFVLKKSPL